MFCWPALPSHLGILPEDQSVMKRRQQGILTGMPFMANITPRTFVDDAGRKLYVAKAPTASRVVGAKHHGNVVCIGAG